MNFCLFRLFFWCHCNTRKGTKHCHCFVLPNTYVTLTKPYQIKSNTSSLCRALTFWVVVSAHKHTHTLWQFFSSQFVQVEFFHANIWSILSQWFGSILRPDFQQQFHRLWDRSFREKKNIQQFLFAHKYLKRLCLQKSCFSYICCSFSAFIHTISQ